MRVLITVVVLLLGADCLRAQTPSVHDATRHRGAALSIIAESSNLKSRGWGDRIQSIKVPKGWQLRFYEHANFRGKSFDLLGPVALFDLEGHGPRGEEWGKRISSLKVLMRPGPAVPRLFEHHRESGRSLSIRRDIADLHAFRMGDTASSINIPSGWTVTLFEHCSFKGRKIVLRCSVADLKRDLPGRGWGDCVSSIRVTPPRARRPQSQGTGRIRGITDGKERTWVLKTERIRRFSCRNSPKAVTTRSPDWPNE